MENEVDFAPKIQPKIQSKSCKHFHSHRCHFVSVAALILPRKVDQIQSKTVPPFCICNCYTDGDVENQHLFPALKEQCEWCLCLSHRAHYRLFLHNVIVITALSPSLQNTSFQHITLLWCKEFCLQFAPTIHLTNSYRPGTNSFTMLLQL